MMFLEQITFEDARRLFNTGRAEEVYVQKNRNSSIERLNFAEGFTFFDFMVATYFQKGERYEHK